MGFHAFDDRHLGQRNISVVNAASPAILDLSIRLGCAEPPGDAELEVQEVTPADMKWLAVLTGKREHGYRHPANLQEVGGIMHPTPLQSGARKTDLSGIDSAMATRLLRKKIAFRRGCDELEVLFHMEVDGLKSNECRIFRILQRAGGRLVGGYTVIARRK